jgi:glutamate synthase (NADPH) small chain
MINKSLTKTKMEVQDPLLRINNFDEVALGYSIEEAILEANRCLECKHAPCVSLCPVEINIPAFIHEIKNRNFEKAYQIIYESSMLPSVCGRVCPQEVQCESVCVRSIKGESVAIGRLERFVADYHFKTNQSLLEKPISNHIKTAVVGSGPAGITCAFELAKKGYEVTLFEALHTLGGVLVYGIPEFRLPKSIVENEIEVLKTLGVTIKTNTIIGRTFTVDDLFEDGYKAVFLATGAGLPQFLNIPGENLNGVYSANEFLTRVNLMKAYLELANTPIQMAKKVAVVGGGNVAMDAARVAKRLGAKEVHLVYRRSIDELPARKEEVEHAIDEGIIFNLLTNPISIQGDEDGFIQSLTLQKMKLGEPDQSNRRRPIPIENAYFDIEVDSIIIAIGTKPNPLIMSQTKDIEVNKWGCIVTKDEGGETTKNNVFAAGDVVTGAATVILAMGAGKKAAHAIDQKLKDTLQYERN